MLTTMLSRIGLALGVTGLSIVALTVILVIIYPKSSGHDPVFTKALIVGFALFVIGFVAAFIGGAMVV